MGESCVRTRIIFMPVGTAGRLKSSAVQSKFLNMPTLRRTTLLQYTEKINALRRQAPQQLSIDIHVSVDDTCNEQPMSDPCHNSLNGTRNRHRRKALLHLSRQWSNKNLDNNDNIDSMSQYQKMRTTSIHAFGMSTTVNFPAFFQRASIVRAIRDQASPTLPNTSPKTQLHLQLRWAFNIGA